MNENAPADMSEFINACSELVDHFGCSVCVVHHTGKDANGARGHSSFYAALDTELTTKRVGQHDVLLKCTKQKDAPEFADMQFMAVTTGNSITLDQIEVQKFDKKYELKGDHRLAFDCFNELLEGKQATIGYVAEQNINLDDGIGINFHPQGGSDVNLLDDYEEGSWTAGVNDYSATYANQQGYYRKVGSLVFATCILAGSGSPGSGNLIVTSLPFSSQNTTAYRSVASFFAWTGFVTGGLQIVGSMSENSNQVTILGINNNGNATTINRSGLNSSGWEFQMSITYCSA